MPLERRFIFSKFNNGSPNKNLNAPLKPSFNPPSQYAASKLALTSRPQITHLFLLKMLNFLKWLNW